MGHSFSLNVRPNVHGFIQAALRPANGQRHTRVVKRHPRRIKRTHAAETRSVHHMVDRRTHQVRTDSAWATQPALRTSGNVRSMRPSISSRCADEDCSSPMGHARPAPLNTPPPPASSSLWHTKPSRARTAYLATAVPGTRVPEGFAAHVPFPAQPASPGLDISSAAVLKLQK